MSLVSGSCGPGAGREPAAAAAGAAAAAAGAPRAAKLRPGKGKAPRGPPMAQVLKKLAAAHASVAAECATLEASHKVRRAWLYTGGPGALPTARRHDKPAAPARSAPRSSDVPPAPPCPALPCPPPS
jgi:hypothetical protein